MNLRGMIMTLLSLIEGIFAIFGFVSAILTIISYFFPTETYPITNWIRNKLNKRIISKKPAYLILNQRFILTEVNRSNEEFKEDIKVIFQQYGFHSDIEFPYIVGNMERRRFHIKITIELPIDSDSILVKQELNINFNQLKDGINTLFDVYRTFQKLQYVKKDDDRIGLTIGSDIFSRNDFIKIFGNTIRGQNFSVSQNNGTYEINFVELDEQETIDKIYDSILTFIKI